MKQSVGKSKEINFKNLCVYIQYKLALSEQTKDLQ